METISNLEKKHRINYHNLLKNFPYDIDDLTKEEAELLLDDVTAMSWYKRLFAK